MPASACWTSSRCARRSKPTPRPPRNDERAAPATSNQRGAAMTNPLYTAEAHVTGGRMHGHGRTSDGELEVDLRVPAELGGQGGGTNPEELFAVGFAACFEGAVATVARRTKDETGDVAIDSKVMLLTTEERGFKLAVQLDVSL